MISVLFCILILFAMARISIPLVRSPARDKIGVANVPFDGS